MAHRNISLWITFCCPLILVWYLYEFNLLNGLQRSTFQPIGYALPPLSVSEKMVLIYFHLN